MSDLKELLERVEKATRADHPLGHEVLLALGARHDHDWDHEYWFGEDRLYPYDITASIDAAVALVEKKLPGWSWLLSQRGSAYVISPDFEPAPEDWLEPKGVTFHGDGSTPALALIAALLKALIAQGGRAP